MKVYFDFNDWWIGYYRGPNHHYVCLVPTLVIRWSRKEYKTFKVKPNTMYEIRGTVRYEANQRQKSQFKGKFH